MSSRKRLFPHQAALQHLFSLEALLAVILLVPHIILMLQHENVILEWFPDDDAFYYFQTARNIAAGNGPTFDGIALSNGFHPLWMLVCIPVFWLSSLDLILPLRILILLQAALHLASTLTLFRLAKRALSPEIAVLTASLWGFSYAVYRETVMGGLETGLSIFLILTLLEQMSRSFSQDNLSRQKLIWLGIIAALTMLARLDNVFLVGIASLWLLYNLLKRHRIRIHSLDSWRKLAGDVLTYSLPILLLVGSYLSWNAISFGSLLPISGQVKQWWGETRNTMYGVPPDTLREIYLETFASTNRDLVPFAPLYEQTTVVVQSMNALISRAGLPAIFKTSWLLLALALFFLLDLKEVRKASRELGLVPLLLACGFHVAYYKFSGHVAQRSWYWISELLLILLFAVLWLQTIVHLITRKFSSRRMLQILTAVACTALFMNLAKSIIRRTSVDLSEPHPYLSKTIWLENHTSPGDRIGMTGSGITGYFINDRTIVNMDGLINGVDYFSALQQGAGDVYLLNAGVTWIFGGENLIQNSEPYRTITAGRITPLATYDDDMILWTFASP